MSNKQNAGPEHDGRGISVTYVAQKCAADAPAEAARELRKVDQLRKQTQETTEALLDAVRDFNAVLDDVKSLTHKSTIELRASRMAILREVKDCLPELNDLRRFFIGSTHEEEIARLREFVDLCERLKRLKDDGFLDDVATTILRLS